jgi:hypothetical protein
MADETAQAAERLNVGDVTDVKKRGARAPARGALGLTVRAVGELLGGVAEASAEAFRGFNAKLQEGADSPSTLGEDVVDGLAEGNARFLEGVAKASRHAYGQMKAPGERPAAPEAIDYERLARLVAAELEKKSKGKGA